MKTMNNNFELITFEGNNLAIIVYNEFKSDGIHFFTNNDSTQQLAYMNHKSGKIIEPHVHNSIKREILTTNEVLLIKKGKLKVDFYSQQQMYLESRILTKGDVILLLNGGHGFHVLEDLEMFEVKQGPYLGELDKIRFKTKN
jgi:mannose-6-phosphate isomerase-like protein (cupin superfamily)